MRAVSICVRTNLMLILMTQANWPDLPVAPQRIECGAAGQ